MKKLERSLSLTSAVAIALSAMLGSGIFVLPGLAAAKTGPSIWLAYLLAAICVLPAVLSKAELATAMPTSGGTYVFVEKTFGPMLGTISGLGLWLSLVLKSAFALVGFGAYLSIVTDSPLKQTSLTLLIVITILNIVGVRKVGQTQVALVAVTVIGLLVVVFGGIFQVDMNNFEPFLSNGNFGLASAVGLVYMSFAGVTKIAAIAEEVKDPGRNLPIAMMLSLFGVALIYIAVTFVLAGNVPQSELAGDVRPIYTLATVIGGTWAGYAAALLGIITMTSMANSGLLAASRFPFAMSRDNLLPKMFGSVHPQFLTPVSCIFLTALAMTGAIVLLDIEGIVKLGSAFMAMMFLLVNASLIILRETAVQWYKPRFRAPFYPWAQIFGIISGIVLLFMLGKDAGFGAIAVTLAGVAVYIFYGRHQSNQSGVLKLYFRRALTFIFNRSKHDRAQALKVAKILKTAIEEKEASATSGSWPVQHAPVVVGLLGKERSSETLVEVGAALANGELVEVVHVTELPYQTVLDAMLEEEEVIQSLQRRITAMSQDKNHKVHFDAVVTHDLVETIHDIGDRLHCDWLVLAWEGRSGQGLFVRNPIGWLITHLSCNLALFRDAGVRYVREILVYTEHGPHDALVAATADHLAEIYSAQLTFVCVVSEGIDEQKIKEETDYVIELKNLCKCSSKSLVISGKDPTNAIIQASIGYDLLVCGSPAKESLRQVILGTQHDKLTEGAACSVLRLTTPRV